MPEPVEMTAPLEMVVGAAVDKKAEGVAVLDVRGISDVTDYFVICHGQSSRQVQTISDTVERALTERKIKPNHVEGYSRGEWVLMDYLEFVVHIFTAERRAYYGLERLWADAPRIALPGTEPGEAPVEEETGPKELDGAN